MMWRLKCDRYITLTQRWIRERPRKLIQASLIRHACKFIVYIFIGISHIFVSLVVLELVFVLHPDEDVVAGVKAAGVVVAAAVLKSTWNTNPHLL